MTMLVSPGGANIFSAPALSGDMLIATVDGVAKLSQDGDRWTIAERWLSGHHVSAIALDPAGNMFVGTYWDGIFASLDGGATWEPRVNGLEETEVWSLIAVARGDGVRLFAGTQPANLYVSDDAGASWTKRRSLRSAPSVESWSFPAPPHQAHVKHIIVDPNDPETVYACVEVGMLLRSADSGETWEEVRGTYEDVHRVLLHPDRPERLIVPTGNGVYLSEDRGATFERLTNAESEIGGYPDPTVLHPASPDLLLVAAAHRNPGTWRESHDAGSRIARSRDGGRSWEVLTNGLPDRFRANVAAMSLEAAGESSQVVAATTDGDVYRSTDEGEHWEEIIHGMSPVSKEKHYLSLALP
jgi:photosystem II stability/assembly factor-like uncharacterized protein